MVTPADRLREKANGLRTPVRYMTSVGEVIVSPTDADEREAVLLDLLADACEAGSACADYCEDLVAMDEWRALLARIEEIA